MSEINECRIIKIDLFLSALSSPWVLGTELVFGFLLELASGCREITHLFIGIYFTGF